MQQRTFVSMPKSQPAISVERVSNEICLSERALLMPVNKTAPALAGGALEVLQLGAEPVVEPVEPVELELRLADVCILVGVEALGVMVI